MSKLIGAGTRCASTYVGAIMTIYWPSKTTQIAVYKQQQQQQNRARAPAASSKARNLLRAYIPNAQIIAFDL
jgi:hypothetical protein